MKELLKKRKNRVIVYTILLVVTAIWICLTDFTTDVKARITYTLNLDRNTENVLSLGTEGQNEYRNIISKLDAENTYHIRWYQMDFAIGEVMPIDKFEIQLQPNYQKDNGEIQIRCIEFFNQDVSIAKYAPEDIKNKFYFENINKLYIDYAALNIVPTDSNPIMKASSEFIEEYNNFPNQQKGIKINFLAFSILFYLVIIIIDIKGYRLNLKSILQNIKQMKFEKAILLLALAVMIVIAVFSAKDISPDEDVSRTAVEFYMGRWLRPNVETIDAVGTFSNMGYTRLGENTFYYLVAGKIALLSKILFNMENSSRFLGIILFGIMVSIYCKKGDKNPWLFLAIGMTPQLWYLFSYTTSDLWDYFFSFLIVYQLAEKESMLNLFLSEKPRKIVTSVLCLGTLFAMVLMGKQNYYFILLFAFIVLIQKWFMIGKEKKLVLLGKYILIAMCSLLVFGARLSVNYIQYGHPLGTLRENELAELNKDAQYRESVESGKTVILKNQGYTLIDTVKEKGFEITKGLVKSFVGTYGWMRWSSPPWYVFTMFVIYGIVLLFIMRYNIRENGRIGGVNTILMFTFLASSYMSVLYLCWKGDFQTQGRYLLWVCLIVAYYASKCQGLFENKIFKRCVLANGILALYSFIIVGAVNLLFYVKN